MPNGISCAFFAGKNLIYGQKENNIFKEGIAIAQTVRTVDSMAQAGIKIPNASGIGKMAKLGKKTVYPLVILSGVYNTVKSKDKVKTGVEQAGGITNMYISETLAEKLLSKVENILLNNNTVKSNKKLRSLIYVLKGAAFVCASLLGYNIGSKTASITVNTIRQFSDNNKELNSKPLNNNENFLFDDMEI